MFVFFPAEKDKLGGGRLNFFEFVPEKCVFMTFFPFFPLFCYLYFPKMILPKLPLKKLLSFLFFCSLQFNHSPHPTKIIFSLQRRTRWRRGGGAIAPGHAKFWVCNLKRRVFMTFFPCFSSLLFPRWSFPNFLKKFIPFVLFFSVTFNYSPNENNFFSLAKKNAHVREAIAPAIFL